MKSVVRVAPICVVMLIAGCGGGTTGGAAATSHSKPSSVPPAASASSSTTAPSLSGSTSPVAASVPVAQVGNPTTVTGLVNAYIEAVTRGDTAALCSLLANSADAPNPDQAPNKPYSAANLAMCKADTNFTPLTSSTLHIGRVITQGNQALVSLVGKACSHGQCLGTDDPNLGMPGPSTGSFADVLSNDAATGGAAQSGPSGDVLACQLIGGRWYVLDDDSDA